MERLKCSKCQIPQMSQTAHKHLSKSLSLPVLKTLTLPSNQMDHPSNQLKHPGNA